MKTIGIFDYRIEVSTVGELKKFLSQLHPGTPLLGVYHGEVEGLCLPDGFIQIVKPEGETQ